MGLSLKTCSLHQLFFQDCSTFSCSPLPCPCLAKRVPIAPCCHHQTSTITSYDEEGAFFRMWEIAKRTSYGSLSSIASELSVMFFLLWRILCIVISRSFRMVSRTEPSFVIKYNFLIFSGIYHFEDETFSSLPVPSTVNHLTTRVREIAVFFLVFPPPKT